jgi:hypothetical protein
MSISKIITGIILIAIGIILFFFLSGIGLFIILIGVLFIIFHKDEEKIEKRKDIKNKRYSY